MHTLDLGVNKIADKGCKELIKASWVSTIKKLQLSINRVIQRIMKLVIKAVSTYRKVLGISYKLYT